MIVVNLPPAFAEPLGDLPACLEQATGWPVDLSISETPFQAEQWLSRIHDARMLVCWAAGLTREVIAAAGQLRCILTTSTAYDHVDVQEATKRGVFVVHAPVNTEATAEYTLALILALTRHVVASDRDVRKGGWHRFVGRQLAGYTLGLVGCGRIGARVGQLALCMGMRVLAYDPAPAVNVDPRIQFVDSLAALLAQAQILSLHVPLTPETRGLIGAAELDALPDGAYVINTARGGLIDEEALLSRVRSGRLGGAALDVYSSEPPEARRFSDLQNIIVTGHIAGATAESLAGLRQLILEAAVAVRRGEQPPYLVNPEALRFRMNARQDVPQPGEAPR
jgi:phosphoglycerate dehydrogenase-like enzyme